MKSEDKYKTERVRIRLTRMSLFDVLLSITKRYSLDVHHCVNDIEKM